MTDLKRVRKKKRIGLLPALLCTLCLCAALLLFAGQQLPTGQAKLLSMAGISLSKPSDTVLHLYWNDPLQYTDGYEILALKADFSPDASWQKGAFPLEECVPQPAGKADKEKLTAANLPPVFDYMKTLAFEKQDEVWTLLYAQQGVLFLHRAHHRYGL